MVDFSGHQPINICMRFYTFLQEVFDLNIPIRILDNTPYRFSASFNTNSIEYEILCDNNDGN
jgi:hypothetical protein